MSYVGPKRHDLKIMTPHFRGLDSNTFRSGVLPIIAFDPGGTTGWSILVLRTQIAERDVFAYNLDAILKHKLIWEHGEIPTAGNEDEAVYQMAKVCKAWPEAAIVVEDFILRAERKEKSRDLLSPVRLTAKLETYLWRDGRKMFLQQAGQAKPTVTDERLELWGCKADDGLPDHARDADRHALLFARRCIGVNGVKVKRAAWPHIYATEVASV